MVPSREAIDRLRRPEYTGENRCLPCTGVNLVLAALLAAAIAGVGVAVGRPTVGGFAGAVGVLLAATAIYLRGYLVPGTPRLTRTYFPEWLLRRFGKRPTAGGDGAVDGDADDEIDAAALLRRVGAVTECERADDLCLTDAFRTAWRDRTVALREGDAGREELATVLDADPERLSFEDYGDGFAAHLDGRRTGQWESRAAFLADVAAANALRERSDVWPSLTVRQRSSVLNGLRIFLDRCPACDGPVSFGESTVESCCRSVDVVAVTCHGCGVRLFEAERPDAG